jgi:hypothetical protein
VKFREAEQRFLLLFLEKEEKGLDKFSAVYIVQLVFGYTLKVSLAIMGSLWNSAKRNNAFCFFFWKKKKMALKASAL